MSPFVDGPSERAGGKRFIPAAPQEPTLDLGRTLTWGALVGLWLGSGAWSEFYGDSAAAGEGRSWIWWICAGAAVGSAVWAWTRPWPKRRRWTARGLLVVSVWTAIIVSGVVDLARTRGLDRRLFEHLENGVTETEVVALLGPPLRVHPVAGIDSPLPEGAPDCELRGAGKILEFARGDDWGGVTRWVYLDAEGRHYCDRISTISF